MGLERECPLIALAVLDLVRSDLELGFKYPKLFMTNWNMDTLLQNALKTSPGIMAALEDFDIDDPSMTENQKLELLVKRLQAYNIWQNLNAVEYAKNEDLILELLAQFFKRKI